MIDYQLVELEEKYLSQVAEIEAASFSEPWSQSSIAMALTSPLYNFYLLVKEEEVLGYVGLSTCIPEAEIVTVAIKPKFRGQGLSKIILGEAIDKEKLKGVDTFFLEVRESNGPARKLYTSFNFIETGRRENFYKKPTEAAVLMELKV